MHLPGGVVRGNVLMFYTSIELRIVAIIGMFMRVGIGLC